MAQWPADSWVLSLVQKTGGLYKPQPYPFASPQPPVQRTHKNPASYQICLDPNTYLKIIYNTGRGTTPFILTVSCLHPHNQVSFPTLTEVYKHVGTHVAQGTESLAPNGNKQHCYL